MTSRGQPPAGPATPHLRESGLLSRIARRSVDLTSVFPQVVLGPGDDCAVVRTDRGDQILLTVDQLVEHRHFLGGDRTSVDLIARKAVARSVSDIAAMGGRPAWALAAGTLPRDYPHADELCEALARWARHWGAPLVGGDIASFAQLDSPLVLSITVGGHPPAGRGPVVRSGARVGDEVWITGAVGGSLASGRHLTFEPRLREGAFLADTLGPELHAMIDVSDGVGRDVSRVAAASRVRIELIAADLPLHADVTDAVRASSDGEDYELVFVVAPGSMPRVLDAARAAGSSRPLVNMTHIGVCVPGDGCVLVLPDGSRRDARELGWDH